MTPQMINRIWGQYLNMVDHQSRQVGYLLDIVKHYGMNRDAVEWCPDQQVKEREDKDKVKHNNVAVGVV